MHALQLLPDDPGEELFSIQPGGTPIRFLLGWYIASPHTPTTIVERHETIGLGQLICYTGYGD